MGLEIRRQVMLTADNINVIGIIIGSQQFDHTTVGTMGTDRIAQDFHMHQLFQRTVKVKLRRLQIHFKQQAIVQGYRFKCSIFEFIQSRQNRRIRSL